MGSPAAARASAVTITSPDPRRPPRSELDALQDANAAITQRDNYADDPNVLEPFGNERDAEVAAAVEAAAWRPELLTAALDEPAAAAFPARLHDAVVDYQRRGWHLFPTGGRGRDMKLPAAGIKWGSAATNDLASLFEWFDDAGDSGIGIGVACGPSRLVVVDVDSYKAEAEESLRWLADNGFDLPATLTAETASGGKHFYYQAPASASYALGNTTAGLPGVERKLPGIDFRADRGYVVAPPTRRGGGEYSFLPNWPQEPAACPDWLRRDAAPVPPQLPAAATTQPYQKIREIQYAFDLLGRWARTVKKAAQVTRQTTLFQATSTLGRLVARGYIKRLPVEQELAAAARAAGLGEAEIQYTLTYHLNREQTRYDNNGAPAQKATL